MSANFHKSAHGGYTPDLHEYRKGLGWCSHEQCDDSALGARITIAALTHAVRALHRRSLSAPFLDHYDVLPSLSAPPVPPLEPAPLPCASAARL